MNKTAQTCTCTTLPRDRYCPMHGPTTTAKRPEPFAAFRARMQEAESRALDAWNGVRCAD